MGAINSAELGFGAPRAHRHFWDEEAETLPREALASLQLSLLRTTARNAYDRVPFHRANFDAAGAGPEDLRTLDDLRKLPFMVKSDLRDHYPFGLFARPAEDPRNLSSLHRKTIRLVSPPPLQ